MAVNALSRGLRSVTSVGLLGLVCVAGSSCLDVRSSGGVADPPPADATPPPAGDAVRGDDRPKLLIDEELSAPVWQEAQRLGAELVVLVTEHHIDPEHDGVPNLDLFRKRLRQLPASYDGYIVIDWETPIFPWLRKGPDSPEFGRAVANLRTMLEAGRAMRPRAKWAFYGLPLKEYWKRDATWRANAKAIQPLLREADALFPSIWDHYRDGIDVEPVHDRRYVQDNVKLALSIAGDTPVYVYVMPRYHHGNPKAGSGRIPRDEFIAHVRAIIDTRVDDRRVAGVIWWDREAWKVNQGKFRDEMRPGESIRAFVDRHHRETLSALAEALWEQPDG